VIVERVKDFQIIPVKYYMPISSVEKLRELLGRAFTGIQPSLPFDEMGQYQVSFSTPIRYEANDITEYFQFLKDRLLDTTSPNCSMKFIRRGRVERELREVRIDEIMLNKEEFMSSIITREYPVIFNIDLLISCTLTNLEL
jgi:hypothetical protein